MMASIAGDDFCFLAEEKFDFEVSLSPASSKGEDFVEDEVFLGPVTHNKRCISHGVETRTKHSASSGTSLGEEPSWSPLLEENFEEIHKEAHLLAIHLERSLPEPVVKDIAVAPNLPEDTEKFEMDSLVKLDMFKPPDTLSPIKRETFCVQDSPMKQLPPAIQKRLQKSSSIPGGKSRLGTSSPVRTCNAQAEMTPRGKGFLPSARVLPKKPTTLRNSRDSSGIRHTPPSKNRSQSCFGLKLSHSSKSTNRTSSVEDLLSDTTCVASDVSESSSNISFKVKRGLSGSSKTESRGGASLRNDPTLSNRRMVNHSQNTSSSSSSSVSSINSSLSLSPSSKCKLNSSLNTSVSGRIPNNGRRLPSSKCKSGIISKPQEYSAGRTVFFSTQSRKTSEPIAKPVKATPIKKTEKGPSVQQQGPAKSTIERAVSMPSMPTHVPKSGSTVKVKSNLKPFMVLTPINSLKGVRRSEVTSPDVPHIVKPKRLMLATNNVDSIPQKTTVHTPHNLQTPSRAMEKPLQSKLRRPSALPTPVNRRVSSIPLLTPKSLPRLNNPASCTPEPQSPTSCSEISHASSSQLKQTEQQQQVVEEMDSKDDLSAVDAFQPCSLVFILEDDFARLTACETVAVKPSETSSDDLQPHPPKPEGPSLSLSGEIMRNHQLKEMEIQEILLVDAPAPVVKTEEKVLIDLSNTPDLIKTIPSKAFAGQLIDLSSPLIKWTPEGKKEIPVTESPPLINLSF